MDIVATATERLAAFHSNHRIKVSIADGGYPRCAVDGLRVHPTRDDRFRHDMAEATALFKESMGGDWPSPNAGMNAIASVVRSEIAREDMTQVVVESGPGWDLVADIEEVPQHNHFDWRDATDDCPKCQYDTLRAEG